MCPSPAKTVPIAYTSQAAIWSGAWADGVQPLLCKFIPELRFLTKSVCFHGNIGVSLGQQCLCCLQGSPPVSLAVSL